MASRFEASLALLCLLNNLLNPIVGYLARVLLSISSVLLQVDPNALVGTMQSADWIGLLSERVGLFSVGRALRLGSILVRRRVDDQNVVVQDTFTHEPVRLFRIEPLLHFVHRVHEIRRQYKQLPGTCMLEIAEFGVRGRIGLGRRDPLGFLGSIRPILGRAEHLLVVIICALAEKQAFD